MAHRAVVAAAAASVLLLALALSGCAPEEGEGAANTPAADASATPSPVASGSPSASASPTPATAVGAAAVPEDCEAPLSDGVLAQLEGIPLNDPANGGELGPQPDGSLVCLWREPAADTTFLETSYLPMNRGPALDLLNQLAADEGFTCYTPDGGTRCEKTWESEEYPVTNGRTLFWRDDLLIDTWYSNLAPSGYTSSIVSAIWPDA
ncbi:hypothetical protein QSU92_11340 [Microbacterium sp. ET2]|uniref:hypothetical protein n=1 Tax=Microbacterium albipurpureum TaxID=3050384 RepID=UPI00259CC9D3|nr:hypothetical protein [Microbacterium sp. ET2 (Ac-2212)]WJL94565.1 hypothetical protein QSU92_11340 [Microbacterium sp. ET2 (Ac-2212)]